MTSDRYNSGDKEESWWEETKKKAKIVTATGMIMFSFGMAAAGIYQEFESGRAELEMPWERNTTETVRKVEKPENDGIIEQIYDSIKDRKESLTEIVEEEKAGERYDDGFEQNIHQLIPDLEGEEFEFMYEETRETYEKSIVPNKGIDNAKNQIFSYIDYLDEKSEEHGTPLELTLATWMLESGGMLNPPSAENIKGPAQSNVNNGLNYGAEINNSVDERMHPEIASNIIAGFLSDLEKKYGDWGLASLAYNQGGKNMGEMFRTYSRNNELDFDTNRGWKQAVRKAEISLPDLLQDQEINEEVFDSSYGLSGRKYVQKIIGCMYELDQYLEENDTIKVMEYQEHTVEKGDTLWSISEEYGVEYSQIRKDNPWLKNPEHLNEGKKVMVREGYVEYDTDKLQEKYGLK